MRQLHELRPDVQMHAEFFPAFARKRLLLRLARLDLSAGKFPQKCTCLSFRTLTQQNVFIVLDQRRHDFQHPLTTLSCIISQPAAHIKSKSASEKTGIRTCCRRIVSTMEVCSCLPQQYG